MNHHLHPAPLPLHPINRRRITNPIQKNRRRIKWMKQKIQKIHRQVESDHRTMKISFDSNCQDISFQIFFFCFLFLVFLLFLWIKRTRKKRNEVNLFVFDHWIRMKCMPMDMRFIRCCQCVGPMLKTLLIFQLCRTKFDR